MVHFVYADDNRSLKAVAYRPAYTDEPYTKLHLLRLSSIQNQVPSAKCAISNLVYDSSVCTDDNHSLKLVAYRPVHDSTLIKIC